LSAVSFADVTLGHGGRAVLSGVSFEIPQGCFVGVLGPNGAGKTTMMRAILGLMPAESGRITVLGEVPARGNPQIGYMPQSRRAASRFALNGREMLVGTLGAARWGRPFSSKAERRAVDEALERVGALHLAERPVSSLSGGERQRLFIAQALMGKPKLLLLDEPLISLDPAHQRTVVDLVRDIARDLGIAVLFSAHEINPILPAIDLILYLGGGKAAIGTVDEVVNRRVLSELYRTPVHVARVDGRIFVMADSCELEHHAHDHDEADRRQSEGAAA
jgi:zinc/manganese transport system ATP-binding protein